MTQGNFDHNAALERFDDFLMRMEDQVEALQDDAEIYGLNLDLRLESLPDLERYFDLASADDTKKLDRDSLIVACGRYLGQVVRLRYGGKWDLALDDPKSVNFNMPVIVGHSKYDVQFPPIMVMRAYALRKRPGTLARAVAADIDYRAPEIQHLIEEGPPESSAPHE